MSIEKIVNAVYRLQKKYDETDPFRLAKAMKVQIRLRSMGSYDGCCKGFFVVSRRIKHITINSDLSDLLQRVVMAHELGHCVLHKDYAFSAPFHEANMFAYTDSKEYEANIFAAELLLPDDKVLQLLNIGEPFFEAAKELYVPYELLDFKIRILKKKGYQVEAPIMSQGDFLKNVEKLPTEGSVRA